MNNRRRAPTRNRSIPEGYRWTEPYLWIIGVVFVIGLPYQLWVWAVQLWEWVFG